MFPEKQTYCADIHFCKIYNIQRITFSVLRNYRFFWLRSCCCFSSPFHSVELHSRNEAPGDGMGEQPPGCSPVIPTRTGSSCGTECSPRPEQTIRVSSLALQPPKPSRANTQFHGTVKHRDAFCQAVGNEKQLKNKSPETVLLFLSEIFQEHLCWLNLSKRKLKWLLLTFSSPLLFS